MKVGQIFPLVSMPVLFKELPIELKEADMHSWFAILNAHLKVILRHIRITSSYQGCLPDEDFLLIELSYVNLLDIWIVLKE